MISDKMNCEYKFSVIIPCFNPPIERFKACINSLISQDYSNYELVVVDDGSDIECCTIAEKLCDGRVSEIKTLRQNNLGVSVARNEGTRIATGDYIMYLDADDELPPGVLSSAAHVLESHHLDIVLGYVKYISKESDKTVAPISTEDKIAFPTMRQLADYNLTGAGGAFDALSSDGSILKIGPVARFVKREIALESPFPEGVKLSEDTLWNMLIFDKACSAAVVPETWYWYWVSHDSASRGYNPDARHDALLFREAFCSYIGMISEKPSGEAVCSRLLGEINRAIKTYYARSECPLSFAQRIKEIRRLTKDMNIDDVLTLANAAKESPVTAVKYLLCISGLGILFWIIRSNDAKQGYK